MLSFLQGRSLAYAIHPGGKDTNYAVDVDIVRLLKYPCVLYYSAIYLKGSGLLVVNKTPR
jgi:hypothetical protein